MAVMDRHGLLPARHADRASPQEYPFDAADNGEAFFKRVN